MNDDVKCPYCEKWQDVEHDFSDLGYEEDEIYEGYCSECEKHYGYTMSMHFYYDAHKAPCMNEENKHEWIGRKSYPEFHPDWKCCKNCGEVKEGVRDDDAVKKWIKEMDEASVERKKKELEKNSAKS